MKIPIIAATLILLIVPYSRTEAQYDDDTSPQKVNLEDIEDAHLHTEKQLNLAPPVTKSNTKLATHTTPVISSYYAPSSNPRDSVADELKKLQQASYLSEQHKPQNVRPLEQMLSPLQHRPSDYPTSTAQRHHHIIGLSPAYSQFVHPVGDGSLGEPLNGNHLQQHEHQQQQVFSYSHDQPMATVLQQQYTEGDYPQQQLGYLQYAPSYEQSGEISDDHHNQQQSYMMTPPSSPQGVALQHNVAPAPPPATATIVTFSHAAAEGLQQQSALQYTPPGVQYVTSNDIHSGGVATVHPNSRGPYSQNPIEFARERNPNGDKSAIEYGVPDAPFRKPLHIQSNQQAYAPQRPADSASYQAKHSIPYPPSFISITTKRPAIYVQPTRAPDYIDVEKWQTNVTPLQLLPRTQHGRAFNPPSSQQFISSGQPVPDIFAGRQAKNLLDSYIPSWLVVQMQENHSRGHQVQVKQQQQQQQPNYNTITYLSALDHGYLRNFKRSPPSASLGEKLSIATKKKSAGTKSITDASDEMMMTS